jgi:hypothetical protein
LWREHKSKRLIYLALLFWIRERGEAMAHQVASKYVDVAPRHDGCIAYIDSTVVRSTRHERDSKVARRRGQECMRSLGDGPEEKAGTAHAYA